MDFKHIVEISDRFKKRHEEGYLFENPGEWHETKATLKAFISEDNESASPPQQAVIALMLGALVGAEKEGIAKDGRVFYKRTIELDVELLGSIALKLKRRQIKLGYTFETMDEWCELESKLEAALYGAAPQDVKDVAERLLIAFRVGELTGLDRKGQPFIKEQA